MDENSQADTALVESYLRYLRDPASLVDHDRVAAAKQALENGSTETERLFAFRDLREAEYPDSSALQANFRKVLPKWAATNRITAEDLASLGVPVSDLAVLKRDVAPKKPKNQSSTPSGGAVITDERVIAHLSEHGRQTLAQLGAALGRSESSMRTSTARLLEDGRIRSEIVAQGTGRRPTVFWLA